MRYDNWIKFFKVFLLTMAVLPIAIADPSGSIQQVTRSDDSMEVQGLGLKGILTGKTKPAAASHSPLLKFPGDSQGGESWTVQPVVGQQRINIVVGNTHVMRFSRPIQRISISDPEIADVAIVDRSDVLINSKEKGAANLIVWDSDDNVYVYNMVVSADPRPLKEAISEIIGKDNTVEVYPTDKGFVVKGAVETVEQQKQVEDTAKAFSDKSVSVVKVGNAKQILLEIRFIEINRTRGMEFGIDGNYVAKNVGLAFLPGATETTLIGGDESISVPNSRYAFPQLTTPDDGTNETFVGTFQDQNNTIQSMVHALEEKNLLKIIARPNLIARDNEEASFLVGGEFPVPIVTDNTQSVNYKEFGTRLKYKPEILKDDMIKLNLETEVSQLDFANGVTLNSFLIPALSSKRTQTVVELQSGQTLLIGGLLQQRLTNTESGLPYLRKIPMFGRMFEHTDNNYTTVELLILITPRLVNLDKDSIDLKNAKVGSPIQTAVELNNAPFDDPKSLAIEELIEGIHGPKFDQAKADTRSLDRKEKLAVIASEKRAERETRMKKDEEFFKIVDEVLYDGKKYTQPDPKNSK